MKYMEMLKEQLEKIENSDKWLEKVESHAPALEVEGLKFTVDVPLVDMIGDNLTYYVTQDTNRKYHLSDYGYTMFNIGSRSSFSSSKFKKAIKHYAEAHGISVNDETKNNVALSVEFDTSDKKDFKKAVKTMALAQLRLYLLLDE